MYLYLAIFWLIVGVLAQFFWDDLQRHAFVHIDRTFGGFVLFVLFSYNFIRWRLARLRDQWQAETEEPQTPTRETHPEYHSEFDFSDSKPPDDSAKK
ncbi:MAG: hypothetical protein HYR84_12385 [Planctomycetes bacterium]|nr:hypothetical protein [Planctomycetota bacterium]